MRSSEVWGVIKNTLIKPYFRMLVCTFQHIHPRVNQNNQTINTYLAHFLQKASIPYCSIGLKYHDNGDFCFREYYSIDQIIIERSSHCAKRQSNFCIVGPSAKWVAKWQSYFDHILHRFSKSWMIWTVSFKLDIRREVDGKYFLSSCNFVLFCSLFFIEKAIDFDSLII
jgi:hypothetical protein